MNQPKPTDTLTVSSPAKINLYLRVGPRRADGFHGLTSWFCSVGLADQLTITRTDGSVSLQCDNPAVPCDGRNLVMKAADTLRPYAGSREGAHIVLQKRVPMGGGLGGGSSNAAATLVALQRFWNCSITAQQMHAIAATLGSDVPFFLSSGSAVCRGRGELIEQIARPAPKAVLLILPGIEMPTPAVYRRFDEMGLGTDLAKVERELPRPDLGTEELLRELVNDLEPPAFAISPELGRLRADLEQRLGRPVRMSGSGSTLFTLYATDEDAQKAKAILGDELRTVACSLG